MSNTTATETKFYATIKATGFTVEGLYGEFSGPIDIYLGYMPEETSPRYRYHVTWYHMVKNRYMFPTANECYNCAMRSINHLNYHTTGEVKIMKCEKKTTITETETYV